VDNILGRIQLQEEAYRKEKNMPAKIFEVYDEQRKGLQALKEKFGPIVKPDLF
jgi:phosphoenolpyruvate carboxykinase (GTP)